MPDRITKSDALRLIYSLMVLILLAGVALHVAHEWLPPSACGDRVVRWAGGNDHDEWQCGPNQSLAILMNPDTVNQGEYARPVAHIICRCNR